MEIMRIYVGMCCRVLFDASSSMMYSEPRRCISDGGVRIRRESDCCICIACRTQNVQILLTASGHMPLTLSDPYQILLILCFEFTLVKDCISNLRHNIPLILYLLYRHGIGPKSLLQ